VDGDIAKDPLVMFARRAAGAKGHSRTHPVPVWKKSTFKGKPVQVILDTEELKVFDPISRSTLPEAKVVGEQITTQLTFDRHASTRFTAKAGLGGAYIAYGDSLRSSLDCDELRKVIALDIGAARQNPDSLPRNIRIVERFSVDVNGGNPDATMYRLFCTFTPRSTLVLAPYANGLCISVGVLGQFMGSLFCPADTKTLATDSDFSEGEVILLGPGEKQRIPLKTYAMDVLSSIDS